MSGTTAQSIRAPSLGTDISESLLDQLRTGQLVHLEGKDLDVKQLLNVWKQHEWLPGVTVQYGWGVKVNPQLVEKAMTMSQIATDTILNSYEPNHPQELLLNKKIIIRRNF